MRINNYISALGLVVGSQVFGANFSTFDTTVQVKTFTQKASDSTFIKLRNTGFTLAYALTKTNDCPTAVIGDFVVRPDTQWIFQSTQDKGDSAGQLQSLVVYYCDFQTYSRQFLTPGAKYQMHQWYKSDGTSDSLYTKVKSIANDTTFMLTVSARDFASTTAIEFKPQNHPKSDSKNNYLPNGKMIGMNSRIWIDSRGNKMINLSR
jgi:hypothetical protein